MSCIFSTEMKFVRQGRTFSLASVTQMSSWDSTWEVASVAIHGEDYTDYVALCWGHSTTDLMTSLNRWMTFGELSFREKDNRTFLVVSSFDRRFLAMTWVSG